MNTLHETIRKSIADAMRARDTIRLDTIRGLVTACTNELVAKGQKPKDFLTDEDTLQIIARTAKQRRDAILQFRAAGRDDLADEDQAQLSILEEYLPTLMSQEDIQAYAEKKKAELGVLDVKEKGAFMAGLMKDLKGKADGGTVKKVVDGLF